MAQHPRLRVRRQALVWAWAADAVAVWAVDAAAAWVADVAWAWGAAADAVAVSEQVRPRSASARHAVNGLLTHPACRAAA